MKEYFCPGCNSIWTELDMELSEGSCLTDPDKCGWEDELKLLISQEWYRKVVEHFRDIAEEGTTTMTAWKAISFAKDALSLLETIG